MAYVRRHLKGGQPRCGWRRFTVGTWLYGRLASKPLVRIMVRRRIVVNKATANDGLARTVPFNTRLTIGELQFSKVIGPFMIFDSPIGL